MITHALDANVISVGLRDPLSGPANGFRTHSNATLAIPSVVRAELLFGAKKGGSERHLLAMRGFLSGFPELPFDEKCVEVYAEARAELERTGGRIGALDLLIAATALAHDLVLVTHNTQEFARVPGLRLEDWQ